MNDCLDPTTAPEGKPAIVFRYESPWKLWNDLERNAYKAEKKQIEPDSGAIMKNIFRRL